MKVLYISIPIFLILATAIPVLLILWFVGVLDFYYLLGTISAFLAITAAIVQGVHTLIHKIKDDEDEQH